MAQNTSVRISLILSLHLATYKALHEKRRNVNCTCYHQGAKNLAGEIMINVSKSPLEKETEVKIEPKHIVQFLRAKNS